jgi:CHASE3 domain sensor protein
MTENIFELASRMKIRFQYRGQISVEDLWDLTTRHLDSIFKTLNSELKTEKEESLLAVKSPDATELELKVAIIRHIVGVKLAEAAEREQAVETAKKREKILEIIERKQGSALEEKSEDDLKKMLEEL